MSYIQIQNKKWRLEVDLQGGRIANLSYGSRCILGTYNRIDGKQGNTHICIPNFGNEGVEEFGLPFHGGARNSVWKVENARLKEENGELRIEVLMRRTEQYKAELLINQTFEFFEDSFVHGVIVTHKGGKPVPVNIGIHNYWNSPNGWEGVLVDGEDITRKVKINGNISLKKKNTIELPRMQPILWEVEGFTHAVVWTAFKGKDFDTPYVCIEPVMGIGDYFGCVKSVLNPNKIFSVFQKISIPPSQPQVV